MKLPAMRVLAVMALAIAVAGCSSLNPFASSKPKPAALTTFTSTAQLSTLWTADIGKSGNYVFQPAVVDNSVYAAANNGDVARFEGGRTVWRTSAGSRLSAGVGADSRLAVVVATDGTAIAYDTSNGSERWRSPIGAEVLAQPAVSPNLVVLRASDNRLIALDPYDGTQRWIYQRNNPPLALRNFSSVLVDGNLVLAGFPGGKLVVINAANGGAIAELTVATPRGATELERVADVAGTPVPGQRDICAVSYQGRAACFDTSNGNLLWAREFSSSVGMDRDSRFAVITDDRNVVHGLDIYSGSGVWKQDGLLRRAVSRPLIVGDHVVVGDLEGYVHVLDRETGAFAARDRAGSSSITADPQRYGHGFVVQGRNGEIHAYDVR